MSLFVTILFYLALIIGIFMFFKMNPRIPLVNRLLMALAVVLILFLVFLFLSAVVALIIIIIVIGFLLSYLNEKKLTKFNFKR